MECAETVDSVYLSFVYSNIVQAAVDSSGCVELRLRERVALKGLENRIWTSNKDLNNNFACAFISN